MTPFTLTAFNFDGIPLDLSGKRDEDDCWIERVCVAGTQHDLTDVLADGVIERLAYMADAHLSSQYRDQRRASSFDFERFLQHC